MQLKSLLRCDAPTAEAALAKHIKQSVLTPEDRPTGPVFKVSGGIDVMPEVARDGIEPPTPAFSGLLTDKAKWFGINGSSWPTKSYSAAPLGWFGMN
jgi:hypothetical protein